MLQPRMVLVAVFFLATSALAADKWKDEITSLPGLTFKPNFKHYAGYLDASLGNYLHYWFFEGQSSSREAPLLLWLNGGPGCSSLGGLFTEHGPFHPTRDGKQLVENVFAWNKLANILYLESPRDIGFSYRDSKTYGNDTVFNDDKTAADTVLALQSFFRAYSEYQFRDFYITGESYGGVYVPTLSDLLIKFIKNGSMPYVNFRGFVIGNGELNEYDQINSGIDLMYFRGIIGNEEYTSLYKCCPKSAEDSFVYCKFTDLIDLDDFGNAIAKKFPNDPTKQKCANDVVDFGYQRLWMGGNDVYNTYQDCYDDASQPRALTVMDVLRRRQLAPKSNAPFSQLFNNYQEPFVNQGAKGSPDSTDAMEAFPCYMSAAAEIYLNQREVRQALHVPEFVQPYQGCSDVINEQLYQQQHHDTSSVFDSILTSGYSNFRILLFNGDADMACNFLGDQWFTERIAGRHNFSVIDARHGWNYTRSSEFVPRIGGYAKSFYNQKLGIHIDSLTVKGGGHFVPTDRPGPALQMLSNFLNKQDYSNMIGISIEPQPLLPAYQKPPPAPVTRKEADRIYDLPGVTFEFSFNQYAGYLQGVPGNFLHYWFYESQVNPSQDPLVLWLTGGPGCSSLMAAMTENGPFHPNRDGKTLYENIYAWNKGANLLFLESPRGVGFSFQNESINPDDKWDDDRSAKDVYLALRDFLTVYPEYIDRPFYITGESYGGIYIPSTASLLVDKITSGELKGLNLKGFAVGNGQLSGLLQVNSAIQLMYYHGFYGKEEYDALQSCCGASHTDPAWFEFCDFTPYIYLDALGNVVSKVPGDQCGELIATLGQKRVFEGGFDTYNMYQSCYEERSNGVHEKPNPKAATSQAAAPFGFVDQGALISHESTDSQDGFLCWGGRANSAYLNQPEVQAALHVNENITEWSSCSSVADRYHWEYNETDRFFENIISKKYPLRMLIYNGDVDAACNFLSDQWFIERLAARHSMPVVKERKAWHYMGVIAGYEKRFSYGSGSIDLLTVKGAGHLVPSDRPGPALQMINSFINDASSYSVPTPYNTNLSPLKQSFAVAEKASAGGPLPHVNPRKPKEAEAEKTEEEEHSHLRRKRSVRAPVNPFRFENRQRPPPPPVGSKEADEIKSLPGLTYKLNFKQYSGYLNPSEGNYLHYWLMEAQEKPEEKPLILWLNGGPGCSSLNGLIQELGPFLYNRDGTTVYENVFAWNKVGNILFLEGPRDVGFSYRSSGVPEDNDYGDDKTADDNVAALGKFFERFPEYQTHDFYMTGESYAGVYLPTLTIRLIKQIQSKKIKAQLKGVGIGNGIMSEILQINSAVSLTYFRGIFGKEDIDKLRKCVPKGYDGVMSYFDWMSEYCIMDEFGNQYPKSTNQSSLEYQCAKQILHMGDDGVWKSGLYPYNTYKDCYKNNAPPGDQNVYPQEMKQQSRAKRSVKNPLNDDPFFDEAKRMSYMSTMPNGGYSCYDGGNYLNLPEVRSAIHIPKEVPDWDGCTDLPKYHCQYRNDTSGIFREIISTDYPLRMMFYNGDADMVCQFLGDQWFTEKLTSIYKIKPGDRTKFMYQLSKEFEPSLAGFQQKFQFTQNFGIDLITVNGAGHLVPVDRPGPALQMIYNFVNNLDYNTPLAKSLDITRKPLLPEYQPSVPIASRSEADHVEGLPGVTFEYPHAQRSGYLQASKGNKLFYWLFEAQTDPARAPLMLWLNGGPGCSSIGGMLLENGPFRPNPDGRTLFENIHSWNKVANVLYIDSPRLVGFSYQDKSESNDSVFADSKTIPDLALALTDFFSAYPQFADNDFYVSGESYAGVYVPALTEYLINEIKSGSRKLNLKGMTVGNGLLDDASDIDSNPAFLYFHGIWDKSDYDSLRECCSENNTASTGFLFCSYDQYFQENPNPDDKFKRCHKRVAHLASAFGALAEGNDVYNMYQDCYTQTTDVFGSMAFELASKAAVDRRQRRVELARERGRLPSRGDLTADFHAIMSNLDPLSTDATGGFQCFMSAAGEAYMAQSSVRRALHVPDKVQPWAFCSDYINNHYKSDYKTNTVLFKSMIDSGYPLRVLIYNGDLDTACSALQAEWFIEKTAKANALASSSRSGWFHRKQIAGYGKRFTNANFSIDLLTVKGSGHFVPTDRSGPSLQMIANFLQSAANYSSPITVSLTPKPLLPQYQPKESLTSDGTTTSVPPTSAQTPTASSASQQTDSSGSTDSTGSSASSASTQSTDSTASPPSTASAPAETTTSSASSLALLTALFFAVLNGVARY